MGAKNALRADLQPCCMSPVTGFHRDGFCTIGLGEFGVHTVCAQMTDEFLAFTKGRGNDLITPLPEQGFPGLKPGDLP